LVVTYVLFASTKFYDFLAHKIDDKLQKATNDGVNFITLY